MKRRNEYFQERQLEHKKVECNAPKMLYPQETDWTCAFACIRTMLSGIGTEVPGEQEFIEKYSLKPGPHFSEQIKDLQILDPYDALYGCEHRGVDFDDILQYMSKGYFVMLESMYNYAHWFVLLGYFPLSDGGIERSRLLIYDPYYDEVRLLNTDEFITMWIDGNYEQSKVEKDFIAVRAK